jgi:hypothetical protein
MAFKPGQSGNPAGRPKGAKGKKTLLRAELEKDGSELARVIKEQALEGDMTAASLWLSRLEPPLRPSAQRVQFQLDPDAPIANQAKAVVLAMSRGEIDPDTARHILDMLSAMVGLRDVETLLDELKALREKRAPIAGGVIHEDQARSD